MIDWKVFQSVSSMRFTTASEDLSGAAAMLSFLPMMSCCFHSAGTAILQWPLSSLMTCGSAWAQTTGVANSAVIAAMRFMRFPRAVVRRRRHQMQNAQPCGVGRLFCSGPDSDYVQYSIYHRRGVPRGLVRLYPGRLHDAAPLLDFGLDDVAEMLRRPALYLDSRALELRAHVVHLERRVDRGIQLRDDLLRRSGRGEYSTPGRGVVARQEFGDRRDIGEHSRARRGGDRDATERSCLHVRADRGDRVEDHHGAA